MRLIGKGNSIVLGALLAALALLAPGSAAAATFTVNTQADTTTAGGCGAEPSCSVRDALAAANVSPDTSNTIEVPAGRYPLGGGALASAQPKRTLTIRGAGARTTTIDAQGASRVLLLEAGNFIIEGLTITGGLSTMLEPGPMAGDGGGILIQSSEPTALTLNRVAVRGNTAQLNGGGVSAPPEELQATALTVNESTIAGNRVTGGAVEGLGGGIYVLGDLTVTNSTITGNSVENPGLDTGGGILAGIKPSVGANNTATLLNSTVAGNSVGAGGVGGGFAIYNPTAGLTTTFAVKNTIVAGNTAGGAPADCSGVVAVTSANNLSSDSSCGFADAASRQGADPKLGGLQDNGGPTDTLALQGGSPAIDAGTNAGCPPTDQRGVTRPQGTSCDIGAFELVPPAAAATPAADLVLKLKPKPKRFKAGKKIRFLLTVSNTGPDAATGVVINGAVPAGTRKLKLKKIDGKRPCKVANPKRAKTKHGKRKRKLTCRLASLAAGGAFKLKIVVRTGTARKVRAQAQVRSAVADPQAKNNKAKAVARLKRG